MQVGLGLNIGYIKAKGYRRFKSSNTMDNSWENVFIEDVKGNLSNSQGNLSNSQGNLRVEIKELLKARLEHWEDVEIKFGITGDSGVGKSSFINAIRGLADDDEGAAKIGVKETTREVAVYSHPTNSKIKFWDLPGIGTPNYPDLETYCEKVSLEKYDTFLILTAGRFTGNDLALAKRVKSDKKSFFFIRTKIDQDYVNEKRTKKAFNQEEMLKDIREDCLENLKGLGVDDEIVFLISNVYQKLWDFPRLKKAILDVLPLRQKECLTLSLGPLTREMLKEKANLLRGRVWMVAAVSAAGAVVPVPGLSIALDFHLLTKELNLYKSQLGLPDENSDEFQRMTPENQEKVRKFCLASTAQIANLLIAHYTCTSSAAEEFIRFIPLVGFAIAGRISFSSTYYLLHGCLNELEGIALDFLDELTTTVLDDMDFD